MKRIYVFGLLLTMLLGLGFDAKAELTVTVTWDTPGSMAPYAQVKDDVVAVPATATSQTFINESTWGTLYLWAGKGYYFVEATTDSGETISPTTWISVPSGLLSYNPINGININTSAYNGQTIHVKLAEVERNDSFTVNVVNGLHNISMFHFTGSGYAPTLKEGKNTIKYNADVDGTTLEIQFAGNGDEGKPYLFTFNDEEAYPEQPWGSEEEDAWKAAPFRETKAYTHLYECKLDPQADDEYMYIQVFENNDEEPDTYDVNITYGENMAGALSMIYDRTANHTYYPAEFEGGVINQLTDLLPGTELRFTFDSDDYNVTQVLMNGVDMSSYMESENNGTRQSILLTITDNTELTINGTAIIWQDIKYYGYISDPEGVVFGLNTESAYDIPYTVVNENAAGTYGDLTLPAGSKEIELTVTEKNNGGRGTFFFKPKEGYFITKCYFGSPKDDGESSTLTLNSAMSYSNDGNTFYMVVEKMDPAYTANLKVVDTSGYPANTNIKGNGTYAGQNDNPAATVVTINHELLGESVFSYIPNYENPFTLYQAQDQNLSVYLDGSEVTGSLNSDSNMTEYTLPLYAPAEGETSDVHSDIQVWFTGSPAMSTATLNLENNATAAFYYSPIMHEANPEGETVITGTYMYVKPTSAKAVVLYKGKVQELDANGLFRYATGSAAEDNTVTVTGPKSIKIAGMIPKAGTAVKSLKQVSLRVPMMADDQEITLDANQEVLLQTIVTLNNVTKATVTEIGEPEMDEANMQMIVPLILSNEITEAGEDYFVKVPADAFIEKQWDDIKEEFVAVPGGYQTAAYSGRFDIDPTMKYPVEIYTLNPAAETTVEEISEVLVSFSEISNSAMFSNYEFRNATFTCGDETVEAIITYDFNSEECRVMKVTPVDSDEEPKAIKTKGDWTMTIEAGTFVYDGNDSPEITATFTVEPKEIEYTLTPEKGTVKVLSTIKVAFPGVTTITETEESVEVEGETQTVNISANIKLEGPEYDKTPSEVKVVNATDDEPAYAEISFTSVLNEGDYTLTIPANAFTLDGAESPVISATYTYKPDWKLTPTPGTTVASLDEFTLEFPEATTVEFIGSSTSFALSDLTDNEGYGSQNFDCEEVAGAAHPTFTIKNAMTVKPASGNYKFYIDGGAFSVDGEENAEIYAEYVLDIPASAEYIRIPEEETIIYTSELEWGQMFGVAFDGGMTIANADSSKVKLTHTDAEGTETEISLDPDQGQIWFGYDDAPGYEGYKSVIVMAYPVELGTYTLDIEAGAFTISGEACPAISESWTVVEDKKFEFETEPSKDGVKNDETSGKTSSLEEISVFIGGATKVDITNPNGATLTGTNSNYQETGTISVVAAPQVRMRAEGTTSGIEVKVSFDTTQIEDNANYIFSMEPGTLKIDDLYDSPAIEKTYSLDTTTGLWILFADENGNVTVYTLDGKAVMQNKPASQLRELEKGVYIINGKKTIVK